MLTVEAAKAVLQPLVIWAVGLIAYGLFTFKFYRYLAKRDILALNLGRFNSAEHPVLRMLLATILWIVEFALAFPIIVFSWFAVLTLILAFLSTNAIQATALISMALVTAVRVTSYFSEDLSRDLAKMMPFAILGVFLVDAQAVTFSEELANIATWSGMIDALVYYLLFIVAVELFLRLIHALRVQRSENN